MTVALSTAGVTKTFGVSRAVDSVSLEVSAGEVVGLLGANGAGKTTLIRLILGLTTPTSGTVAVLGGPPDRSTRARIGYMPQGLGLYPELTVAQNLQFVAAAFKTEPAALGAELAAVADMEVARLPLGLRRRVAFVAALGHRPEVLVLDEPTSGVGPLGRAELWDTIQGAAAAGAAVLVSTHYMDEAEQCGRLVMLADGRQVAAGSEAEIVGNLTSVRVSPGDGEVWDLLAAARLVAVPLGADIRVPGVSVREVVDLVGPRRSVVEIPATLEDAFVAMSRSR